MTNFKGKSYFQLSRGNAKFGKSSEKCILHMGDFPQPQQKSAGAGENQDFGAIWAGPSQTATFMPFWIYNIQVCKRSDMKKHF